MRHIKSYFDETNHKFDALAAAGVQNLKNQCFYYFNDFHLQKPPKKDKQLSMLRRVWLKNPFEKHLEISFVFYMIFDRFWDDLGRVWGGTLGDFGVQGVPWRCPREVFSTEWLPDGPRERFWTILAPFCMEFWTKFNDF